MEERGERAEAQSPATETGWYVYCLLPFPVDLPPWTGMGDGSPLVLISEGQIGALTSPVPLAEFGAEALRRNLQDLRWVEARARRHEEIVEAAMARGAVFPMKLCTIFLSPERVRGVLRENAEEIRKGLDALQDKEEWGLKGFSDRHRLQGAVLRLDPELIRLGEELSSKPPGQAFFLRRKLEELIRGRALHREGQLILLAEEAVQGMAVEVVENPPLPRRATGRREEMVLNLACLLRKEEVDRFLAEVRRWNGDHAEEGLELIASGPWPPYHFSPRLGGHEG